MDKKNVLLLSALALLSIRGYAEPTATTAANPTSATMQCPSTSFPKFLTAFIDSPDLQKTFTHLPASVSSTMPSPIIPSAKTRNAEGMKIHTTKLKRNRAEVILDKPETDFKVVFYFQKKKCWQLVGVKDLSG
jgi:hypothetical protein